jgi:hypothetical protein
MNLSSNVRSFELNNLIINFESSVSSKSHPSILLLPSIDLLTFCSNKLVNEYS